jgi:hypothetical protein
MTMTANKHMDLSQRIVISIKFMKQPWPKGTYQPRNSPTSRPEFTGENIRRPSRERGGLFITVEIILPEIFSVKGTTETRPFDLCPV